MNSVLTHINEYGNPFEDEDCPELLVLHTRECAADEVQASMKKIEALGKNQYNKFTKEVFEKRSLSIDETIKKNSLPMFANSSRKKKSSTAKIKALRHDVSVFGRLYISNQYRDGDPDVFFAHENQPYPPSLADLDEMRLGAKSDLLKLLQDSTVNIQRKENRDCKIFDGGALIHMLTPKAIRTFSEYSDKIFLPFLKHELEKVERVDVVWDRYLKNSIKNSTRAKRGNSIRVKVGPRARIPSKWNDFLRDPKKRKSFSITFLKKSIKLNGQI